MRRPNSESFYQRVSGGEYADLCAVEVDPPIEKVIACGVVSRFVEFLQVPHELLQVGVAFVPLTSP